MRQTLGANTDAVKHVISGVSSTTCSYGPSHNLANAHAAVLRKLAEYEKVCSGAVAGTASFFVPFPASAAQANANAEDVAAVLSDFEQHGIKPLIFLEPTNNGKSIDFKACSTGAYDAVLDVYFKKLKTLGVTSATMGTWVIFPEANIPVWNTVDPALFVKNVTKIAGKQKQYFPGSNASVMLDSMTYPSSSSWSGGRYISLKPYLANIPRGFIDSFGLQGFPWSPPAGQDGALYSPPVYLRTDLAVEAARTLGVKEIWFNTGTFGRSYAQNASQRVLVTASARQQMLDQVVQLAASVQSQGYSVAVHLFAENKSTTSEGIDWAYWHSPANLDKNSDVFTSFARNLRAASIPLWLFDTE